MIRSFAWFAVLASSAFLPLPSAAAPDEFGRCVVPAGYYRIATTAEGSDLHLRAKPQLEAERIDELQRSDIVFSDGSRTVHDDVTWQKIKILQTETWAKAGALWRALPLTLDETELPVIGSCGDFRPLWMMSWSGHDFNMLLYPGSHAITGASVRSGQKPGTVLVSASRDGAAMTMVYSDEFCSDPQGKAIGWGRASLIVRDASGERLFTGCCETSVGAFARR